MDGCGKRTKWLKNENVSVTEAGEIERGEKEEYISTENENSEIGEKTSTLVEYTIFYVALTGSFVLAAVLLWKVAEGALEYFLNDTLKHKGFSDFLTEYSTPFTILLITVCALSTFTSQGISEEGLIKFFEALAGTVLLLLLLLIAVYYNVFRKILCCEYPCILFLSCLLRM